MRAGDLSDLEFVGREALLEQRNGHAETAGRPAPCGCERPRLYRDADDELVCFRCGRPAAPAANGNGLELVGDVPAGASRAEWLDVEIRQTATVIRVAWIHLARCLDELHREKHFKELGHKSFASYVRSIEVDVGYAYKLLRVYRALVVGHNVDPEQLEGVSADKLDIACRPGVWDVAQLLADVRSLTPAQLLERYRDELPPAPECPACGRALPRTGMAGVPKPRRYPLLADADWLRERYVDRGMSQKQIADEVGCSQVTVSQALRRHGIPTRRARFQPRAEARRFQLEAA